MFPQQFQFKGARAQIQRVSDARFFGGWVEQLDWPKMRLKIETHLKPSLGDEFSVRLYGPDMDAVFRATLLQSSFVAAKPAAPDAEPRPALVTLGLHIHTAVDLVSSSEDARFTAPDLRAYIRLPFKDVDVPVLDISSEGIGVLSPIKFGPRQLIQLQVFSQTKVIECTAEVRYCRKTRGPEQLYRLGLKVQELARMDAPYWRKLWAA